MDLDTPRITSKGNPAEYQAIHKWISRECGKANHCSFDPSHQATTFHWANISQEYKWELSDWIQLCPRCHRKYDARESTRELMRQKSKGNTYRRRPVIRIDIKRKISYFHECAKFAGEELGILDTSINNCLKGHTKTAGGYRWQYKEIQS